MPHHHKTRSGQGCGLSSFFSPPFVESKKPASEETGLIRAVRTIARYRWHESLHPALPLPDRCPTGSPTARE
jgi:hypothetical protein